MLIVDEKNGVVIIGLGRAGRARVAHLSHDPKVRLVGIVSRRAEIGTLDLATALQRQDVNIIVVATENASHAQFVEIALRALKHVVVEFPLCQSAVEAKKLYDLARQKGRILHVELIGLLTRAHENLLELHLARPIARIIMQFQGNMAGWLAAEHTTERWGQLAIGRLHAAIDLAGPLKVQDVAIITTPNSYQIEVKLRSETMKVELHERRGPDLPRQLGVTGWHTDGSEIRVATAETPESGLFARDWAAFAARLASGAVGYASEAEVLHALELAEEISARLSVLAHKQALNDGG